MSNSKINILQNVRVNPENLDIDNIDIVNNWGNVRASQYLPDDEDTESIISLSSSNPELEAEMEKAAAAAEDDISRNSKVGMQQLLQYNQQQQQQESPKLQECSQPRPHLHQSSQQQQSSRQQSQQQDQSSKQHSSRLQSQQQNECVYEAITQPLSPLISPEHEKFIESYRHHMKQQVRYLDLINAASADFRSANDDNQKLEREIEAKKSELNRIEKEIGELFQRKKQSNSIKMSARNKIHGLKNAIKFNHYKFYTTFK